MTIAFPATPQTESTLRLDDLAFLQALVLERLAVVVDATKPGAIAVRLVPIVRAERLESIGDLVGALRLAPRGRLEQRVIEAMTDRKSVV